MFLLSATLTTASLHAQEAEAKADDQKVFYYLGTGLGRNLISLGLSDDETKEVIRGMRASLAGDAEKLDDAIYGPKLNELAQQRMAVIERKEKIASEEYLKKMAAEDGAVRTDSGLVYLELEAGTGAQAEVTSAVKAHYQGVLRDGTEFDSSFKRGQPLSIKLSDVIPCWTEAIAMMKEGGKSKISCPASTAYGSKGTGAIPPGAALTFEVELIEVMQ